MGRRRKARVTVAGIDRRATDLPHNAEVADTGVKDPYDGQPIVVVRSVRDDPVGKMGARGQIDEAQLAAARHWQRDYENSEIGGIRASDTTREPVDGGGAFPEPITDTTRRAVKSLTYTARKLGQEGDALIRHVLGQGMSIEVAAAARGMSGNHEIRYLGRRFRECLETLAVLYGYASKPKPVRPKPPGMPKNLRDAIEAAKVLT
jgi:hypothetical protein